MSRFAALKEECHAANLLLPHHKLVDFTFGNVSVIDRAQGVFAIKPSGVDYHIMSPHDMVVLDLDGKQIEGIMRPSSDAPTHRRLFQAFPDMRAVVHTHSRHATAFAQAGRPIPCFGTTHADYFYGEVPVTRPMTASEVNGDYEWETGNVIVERFQSLNAAEVCAVLVHGHGSFVWGPDGTRTVERAMALEIVAQMAMHTLQIDPNAQPISQYLLDRHFRRKHGADAYYGQQPSTSAQR